ncbi:MAG: DUF962 domain-containing protein [Isosphaeraceae bacterium]|nr:DUF962 domain-containing protein [Isosphaeraceae bacterium]
MLCPPHEPSPLVTNWLERHRDPISFVLHMIGIPPTIVGVLMIPVYVYMMSFQLFLLALALFVGGYLLQFLGHAVDGNDPGEIIMLKRKLGLSYVEIAPDRRRVTQG